MSESKEVKLEVKKLSKPARVAKDKLSELKGVVSGRQIGKLKLEGVECPNQSSTICFLECFVCDRFIRRVKGYVYCSI